MWKKHGHNWDLSENLRGNGEKNFDNDKTDLNESKEWKLTVSM